MSTIPIFNGTQYPAYQQVPNNTNASVGTTATAIYSSTSFVPVGGGAGGTFPTGSLLPALTIINTGGTVCYIGSSSVTTATGVPLQPGQQLTISGGPGVVAATAGVLGWNFSAITPGGTTTIEASLPTLVSVA